jgi:hypothetical protein
MGLDGDEDPKEPKALADADNDDVDGDNADISDLDSDHDE